MATGRVWTRNPWVLDLAGTGAGLDLACGFRVRGPKIGRVGGGLGISPAGAHREHENEVVVLKKPTILTQLRLQP